MLLTRNTEGWQEVLGRLIAGLSIVGYMLSFQILGRLSSGKLTGGFLSHSRKVGSKVRRKNQSLSYTELNCLWVVSPWNELA